MELAGGTLSIDIGGSGIKAMVLDPTGTPINEKIRVPTPRPANPKSVLTAIAELAAQQPEFARVSVGFPGVVDDGVTLTAPNLDEDWAEFPIAAEIARITGKGTRVANDADVQGYGVIEGHGVEMVITLGTGMGSAIFTEGRLVPNLELGHHPLTKSRTYEQYVGDKARRKLGKTAWSARVGEVIEQIMPIWNPRVLYLGGGNAKRLTIDLPPKVRRVENVAGILGGIRLWTQSVA